MDGTIHQLVVKQQSNAQMAQDDQQALDEPPGVQDESNLYFGAENPDTDEDDVKSDTSEGRRLSD